MFGVLHDVCSQQLARLRQYTMGRFINHDGISDGVLNIDYNGGVGFLASWKSQLQNNQGLLDMMLQRLQSDWTTTAPKMRKPWNKNDLDSQLSFFFLAINVFNMFILSPTMVITSYRWIPRNCLA